MSDDQRDAEMQALKDQVEQLKREAAATASAEQQAAATGESTEDVLTARLRDVQVPKMANPTTADEVLQFGRMFAEFRAELAAIKGALTTLGAKRATFQVQQTETLQDRTDRRLAHLASVSHYCPECGATSTFPKTCEGRTRGDHPPRDMVSTEELSGDPANHTAARSSDPDQPDDLAAAA